jgi:hypothetical protein
VRVNGVRKGGRKIECEKETQSRRLSNSLLYVLY